MKKNTGNSSSSADRVMSRLAADKQKVVMALCLIAVMAFMWARVLSGKGPESAEAAVKQPAGSQQNSELKISFIELPKVEGRNDVLSRDFFAVGKGRLSSTKTNSEKLELEAIVSGEQRQAFINDKLLVVGDKLFVSDDVGEKEYEVIEITENIVLMRCGESKITLKLE